MAFGVVASGCASSGTDNPVEAPITTAALPISSATVPPLGVTPAVLPATPGNAEANARGSCSRFAILYIRLAQGAVPAARALVSVDEVRPFADAAGSGDPGQWGQLRADVASLAAAIGAPSWTAGGAQANLPAVRAVYNDCVPLQ